MRSKSIVLALSVASSVLAATFAMWEPRQSAAAPNALGMEFVKLEPGIFRMGCSSGDNECRDEEQPAHTVRISRAFEIGKYEVTRKQWNVLMGRILMGRNTCDREEETYTACVTWNEAEKFVIKMNERKDGYRYRLPTEAEWEYAARAGTTSRYGGGANVADVGWYYAQTSPGNYGKHPGVRKKANVWGLFDTLGNAEEWVQDWYDDYGSAATTDPKGPPTGSMKVMRGGSFNSLEDDFWFEAYTSVFPAWSPAITRFMHGAESARRLRVSYRGTAATSHDAGFRVAREVSPAVPGPHLNLNYGY